MTIADTIHRKTRFLRVLVACEFSGHVRDAFRVRGHDAYSCDLAGVSVEGFFRTFHLVGDCRRYLSNKWDLMIAHPPCTYLAISGARWFKDRRQEQQDALAFVRELMDAPISRIAIENPKSVISTMIRKPDQIIQPWQFGHHDKKGICLWLKNLPLLTPTKCVDWRAPRVHFETPSADRTRNRSRTYTGIAEAMAEQWGAAPN